MLFAQATRFRASLVVIHNLGLLHLPRPLPLNWVLQWVLVPKLDIQYDHTSAEWINERTEFSGSSYCPGDPKVAIYPSCYWYYDSPGTTSWTHQWFSAAENDYGPWSDPFSFPFEAEVMVAPTTHDNPTPFVAPLKGSLPIQ